jgi:hypothetical protein
MLFDLFPKRKLDFEKDLRQKIQHSIRHDFDGIYVSVLLYKEALEKIKPEMPYLRVKESYTVEGSIYEILIYEKGRRPTNKIIDYCS